MSETKPRVRTASSSRALHINTKDLTGLVFGELTVVGFDRREERGRNAKVRMYWTCRCSCGEITSARGDLLKTGNTRSCGHLQALASARAIIAHNQSLRLDYGEGSFSVLFANYRNKAEHRELEFLLSRGEFQALTTQDCFYCGKPPSQVFTGSTTYGPCIYNGVDRVDSSRGYTPDNVRACCKRCNGSKSDQSEQEFYDWIRRVYETLSARGTFESARAA